MKPQTSRGARPRVGRIILGAALILLLPAALILQYVAAQFPKAVERFYSRGFYRAVSGAISKYFNLFEFSCAELVVYSAVIFAVFLAVIAVVSIIRKRWLSLARLFVTAAYIFTTGYFLFTVMWGLNYNRVSLEESLKYKTGSPSVSELSAMLQNETNAINSLCDSIPYDENGRSHYTGGFQKISARVNDGYEALSRQNSLQNDLFGLNRPRPKGILASKLMSYTSIEGIFIPFTYEPNVNTDSPDFVLPFDASHESAHFKGFAREQEANFIAYLACCKNSDLYFQYSAHMEAYIYISNALYETDTATFKTVAEKLDRRAAGDFKWYNEYITAHRSYATEVSNKVNDSYLKSQGQKGVITYDMFVTLLADKYRTEH